MTFVEELAELFENEGSAAYFGEAVTQAQHMLQAGALAEAAGAPPPLVAAALLHDVGHFGGPLTGDDLMAGTDNRHEDVGARLLGSHFGPSVSEPVRLHVPAKRYLCRRDPSYHGSLSEASQFTLELQGGPMSEEEALAFEAEPYSSEAVRLRRWDDAAKDPDAQAPAFARFAPMLERLLSPAVRR